jgi:hypothetical protein
MTLQPGDRLGPYEILARIGAGGMGDVFRARDTRLDRLVAIKDLEDGVQRAVRARGPGRGGAQSLRHLYAARRRAELPRDGVHRGHAPRGAAARGPGPEVRGAGLRGARRRAPEGHHPPRPEAREHPRDQERHQAAGLRPGEARRRGRREAGAPAGDATVSMALTGTIPSSPTGRSRRRWCCTVPSTRSRTRCCPTGPCCTSRSPRRRAGTSGPCRQMARRRRCGSRRSTKAKPGSPPACRSRGAGGSRTRPTNGDGGRWTDAARPTVARLAPRAAGRPQDVADVDAIS